MARAKPRAFVIMTFDDEFDAVYDKLILPALTECGFDVGRADTNLSAQNIMKDVIRGVADADVVIADLTDLNPNVFYELGVAHGLNRRTVLLTQSIETIPFDLKGYRVVEYSRIFDKAPQLVDVLKEFGRGLISGTIEFGNPVSDFMGVGVGETVTTGRPPATKGRTAATRKKKERTEKRIAERGILDWLADQEKSSASAVKSIERMSLATTQLGEKLTARTELLKKEQGTSGVGRSLRIQSIAQDAAADLNSFAETVEKETPIFKRSWQKFMDATVETLRSDAIKTAPDRDQLIKLKPSLKLMLDGLGNARTSMEGMRKACEGLQGISFKLTGASKRSVVVLDKLIGEIETSKAGGVRVMALVDELITESRTSSSAAGQS